MTVTVRTTRTLLTTLPAFMLRGGDVIVFPATVSGVPIEGRNPLATVAAIGASADPYLDDAEPVTLITEDEAGNQLIDHVEPSRRFFVAREVDHILTPYEGGDYVD